MTGLENRIRYLIQQYLENHCSRQEYLELIELLQVRIDSPVLVELLEPGSVSMLDRETGTNTDWNKVLEKILTNRSKPEIQEMHSTERRGRLAFLKPWQKIAAAAVLILLAGGAYFMFYKKDDKQTEIVKTPTLPHDVKAPATNRAFITLTNGRTVFLDSALNGELAVQGNIKLVKLANGQIAYQTASGEIIKELQYNTLSNPRGSKVIDMQLSDGSHIWLNAGSSVTYPVAFVDNERKVSITGEAYFEIAHDKSKPFQVSKGGMTVEVLGTRFNVNAYEDEEDIKVTLVEGSVKVRSFVSPLQARDDKEIVLKPGQQARVATDIKLVNNADIESVLAWKNGLFSFDNADLKTIMRQIEKWYDVEVEYQGEISEKFRFKVDRNTSAANVFKILEETGFLKFRIQDRKIIVLK